MFTIDLHRRLRRAGVALLAVGFLLVAAAPPALARNRCRPRRRPLVNILRGIGAILSSVAVGIHIGHHLPPQTWRLPPPRPVRPRPPPILLRPPPPPPIVVVRPPRRPRPPIVVVRPPRRPRPPVVVVRPPHKPRPRGDGDGGYDREGYDREGYDRPGYDRDGYDRDGYDRDGYDRDGYDRDGYDRDGYDWDGEDRDGRRRRPTRKGYDPHFDDLVRF